MGYWEEKSEGVGILVLYPSLEVGIGIRQMERSVCVCVCAQVCTCTCFLGKRTKQDDTEKNLACHGNYKYII